MIAILSRRLWVAVRIFKIVGCVLLGGTTFVCADVYGQIVRDGSLGQKSGALSGPNYTIDVQSAAQQRGNNLFHSFSDFNVNTGQSATFTGPNSIANIISRVTGRSLSNIDGVINSKTAMPNANFFLINPNGLILGPNASMQVGGSVYLSTAHYLVFSDEGVFNTRAGTAGEVLSSFPVVSFGFLQNASPAPITITGSTLTVGSGQTLSVIGGPVKIDGAQLSAPNGKVQVASVDTVGFRQFASYDTVQTIPAHDIPGDIECDCSTKHVPETTVRTSHQLGYGGEVSSDNLTMSNLTAGSITMNPGSSFAALDAGPNGTVQTSPAPADIRTPTDAQKLVQPNLIKIGTAPTISTISQDLTIEEGQTTTITISLNKPAEITETVTLSNSNAGAATTTPSGPTITFKPNEQTQTVQVTGVKEGNTKITATLRNVAQSTSVAVVQRLAFSPNLTPTVELGLNGTFTITLNRTSSTPTEVTLSSLNPTIAVPSATKVTIPANEKSSAPIDVRSVGVGTATIRAALGQVSVDRSIQVSPISLVSLSGVSIVEGQSGTATVTLPRVTPSTVTVTLTSSNPNVATVETSVNVLAGQSSAPVTVRGVTDGIVQLRAQSGNSSQTANVVVNALQPPPLTSLSPLSLKVGNSGTVTVVLKEAFKRDVTVLLKSSDPATASITDLVTVPAGATASNPIAVSGNKVGQATIVASLANSTVQGLVDVTSAALVLPGGADGTAALALAAQYPQLLAIPQAAIAAPLLLAAKCAGDKDGQFSSFAQLHRDSSPPQPGRYLSSPSILGEDLLRAGQSSVPDISISMGAPKLLNVAPEATFLAMNACGR